MRVTVVGAGVSGLTTALVLQRRGHEVEVVAAAKGVATTSGAAGAIWYPFRADPPELVTRWATVTRRCLEELAVTTPDAGVDVLTMYEFVDDSTPPWWASCVDDLRWVEGEHGYASKGAWVFSAPRVDPGVHLPWLEGRLARPVTIAAVRRLEEVPGDVVVNCTGLGARALTGDRELFGIYGQTVTVSGGTLRRDAALSDERLPEAMFYAIPRRQGVVLGGCAIDCDDSRSIEPEAELRDAILERCRAAGFDPGEVTGDRAALRPGRTTVRVEREGRVVHNYGHGGAGYTLAWGCAEDVAALVDGIA